MQVRIVKTINQATKLGGVDDTMKDVRGGDDKHGRLIDWRRDRRVRGMIFRRKRGNIGTTEKGNQEMSMSNKMQIRDRG